MCSSTNANTVTMYSYPKGNYERMCQQLEAINFQHEFNLRDIDSAYEFFQHEMENLIQRNVPKITIKKYSTKPRWWSPLLQRLKNRRDKLFKRKIKGEMIDEYYAALEEFDILNKRRHKEFIDNIQENIKSNPKEF